MFWRGEPNESAGFSFYGFVKIFAYLWKAKDKKEKIICPQCRVSFNRMIKSQEEDEFIAVRVQDPRVQNEGSWNSHVDFKIFLHTNSKAFTAKTSCVRRRYSEFVWLKKKLQKNAGLVPVPDLPKKSYFSFVNDDFIERRRKGLQSFLDRVVHMTVCLSDSQLHLFLQTQLPVKHIEDCVQGHTPYTVTEAILNYASSNRGWVQEEGGVAEEIWTAPVPYESTDSPARLLPSSSTPDVLQPLSEHKDDSDVEAVSRLSDTEQTGLDLKQGSEQMVQEEETQRLDDEVSDIQRDGCEYNVPQIEGPLEVKPLQGDLDKAYQEMSVGEEITSVHQKRTTSEGEKGCQEAALEQESTVRRTSSAAREDPAVQVHYCEVIPDLSAAQKNNAEEGKHRENGLDKTWEDVALDGASTSEENISNTKDQEQCKAMITEEDAIQVNGERENETNCRHSEISETCLSHSDSECNGDHVGEVNKINAKCVHTGSAVLILEGIEEALVTQTAPMTETQDVSTEISNEDRHLNANTADVTRLVLQATEIDSVQCQHTESHITTAQQPDAN